MNEETLRSLIREIIVQELEENSTSAATPGYMTPNAFQGNSAPGKNKHHSNVAATREYTIVEPEVSADPTIKEGRSRYLDFKQDESATVAQKIGRTLMEMNKSLTEMERVVTMASRLKTETNTPQSSLWRRSLNHLVKVEGRILKLAHRIQELKQ